jgi:hypothetical protein
MRRLREKSKSAPSAQQIGKAKLQKVAVAAVKPGGGAQCVADTIRTTKESREIVQQLDIGKSWRQIAAACAKRTLSNEEGSRRSRGRSFWRAKHTDCAKRKFPSGARGEEEKNEHRNAQCDENDKNCEETEEEKTIRAELTISGE